MDQVSCHSVRTLVLGAFFVDNQNHIGIQTHAWPRFDALMMQRVHKHSTWAEKQKYSRSFFYRSPSQEYKYCMIVKIYFKFNDNDDLPRFMLQSSILVVNH